MGAQEFARLVVARDAAFLAALLVQDQRCLLAAVVEVADGHAHGRADPDEAVEHDGEQRPVAQRQDVAVLGGRVEGGKELARLRALEDRGLAFCDDQARGAYGERRVLREHAALGEVIEPVPQRRGGEFHGGLRDVQPFEVGARARAGPRLGVAPRAEAEDRAAVSLARVRVREARGEKLEREARRCLARVRDDGRQRHRDAARRVHDDGERAGRGRGRRPGGGHPATGSALAVCRSC